MGDPIEWISGTRENIVKGFDDLKKAEDDFGSVIKAAINFRQQLLELNEAAKKLVVEMRKLGEGRKSRWAIEFSNRARDQERIENSSYEMQTKFWDDFILPLMTSAEKDSKDLQITEKKVKQISSSLLSDAKKKKSEFGKGTVITIESEGIKELVGRHDELSAFLQIYKQRKFHKWLKHSCSAFNAQRDHYGNCLSILKDESWKVLLNIQHPPLPDIDGNVETRRILSSSTEDLNENLASSGTVSAFTDYPVPYNNAIKCGYLVKRGEKMKNWKKRYFVLTPDNIYYFDNEKSVKSNKEPLGSVLLMMCSNCSTNTHMKKDNCFELTTPNRTYYFCCSNKDDLDDWMKTLSSFIYSSVSTPYLMDQVQNHGQTTTDAYPDTLSYQNQLSMSMEHVNQALPELSAEDVPPPSQDQFYRAQNTMLEEEEEWKTAMSPDGIPYYYNTRTKETKWENPGI